MKNPTVMWELTLTQIYVIDVKSNILSEKPIKTIAALYQVQLGCTIPRPSKQHTHNKLYIICILIMF